jgi:hypothetical protein
MILRPAPGRRRREYHSGLLVFKIREDAAVALLIANRGPMTPAAIRRALEASADKVHDMRGKRFSRDFGAGRLNLERLLARRSLGE